VKIIQFSVLSQTATAENFCWPEKNNSNSLPRMLSKTQIQDVILRNVFQPSTVTAANKIASELGLGPGSVVLGDKTIAVTESGQTRHFQIGADSKSIVEVNPAEV
jgi:hypothetical protein